MIHTVTLKQTECRKRNKKIAAAVYLYQADNDGEWGNLRFDFENGTAEIVKLADWDTVKSNIFAKNGDPVHTGIAGGENVEICDRAVLERQGIITRRA